jgi:hypothetical protein
LEKHHKNGTITYSHQSSLQGSKGDAGGGAHPPRQARSYSLNARAHCQAGWHREQ